MARRSPLFRTCLVALLVLSGVQVAAARGAPPPVGTMVICAGHGLAVVLVDANGKPVRASHLCPDATFGADVTVAEPVAPTAMVTPVAAIGFQRIAIVLRAADRAVPRARGPPAPV